MGIARVALVTINKRNEKIMPPFSAFSTSTCNTILLSALLFRYWPAYPTELKFDISHEKATDKGPRRIHVPRMLDNGLETTKTNSLPTCKSK